MKIRTRLTVTYTAALALILAVAGLVIELLYRQNVVSKLDEALVADVEDVEHQMKIEGDGSVAVPTQAAEAPGQVHRRIRVASTSGAVYQDDPFLARVQPPGEAIKYTFETAGGLRSCGTLCKREGRVYVVQVARPEPLGEIVRMRWTLGLAMLATLALAGTGAWIVVGRALKPVDRMTRAARQISAESSTSRIPVGNESDELGRLAQTLNDMLERLASSIDRMRQFTSDASHELRTPLTAMRSVGEVALCDAKTVDEYREAIGSILEEIDRLTRLVEQLLFLARADAGAIKLQTKPVALAEIVSQTTDRLAILAEDKGIALRVDGMPKGPFPSDPNLLGQALTNIIDNAIKFTPKGGTVDVGASIDGAEARIWIEDSGPGIPPEHLGRIFERFYRVDRDRSAGGTGLGLAIARWAIESQGGRIQAQSEPGKGCKFTIILKR
jgi:heavy metal sensor kinase